MLRLIVGRRYLSEDWKRLVTIVRGKTKGIALITSIREEATNSRDIFRSIQPRRDASVNSSVILKEN